MASKEEFSALVSTDSLDGSSNGGTPDWMKSWSNQNGSSSPTKSRPPKPGTGERSPLLPPMPQSREPPPKQSMPPPKPRGHGRSRSDYAFQAQSDPSHPFNKATGGGGAPRPSRPPRSRLPDGVPPPPPPSHQMFISPLGMGSPSARKKNSHRRAKSDIPLFDGRGGNGSVGGGRVITKADLLKNLPNPRWGGAKKPLTQVRNRSRSGSDGPLLEEASATSGGFSGYGATSSAVGGSGAHPLLSSIGSVELSRDARRASGSTAHRRNMSDMSAKSVTTDMAKSALFKGVTEAGRLQLQLPKDSFRMLMDSQLEAGYVYKRKLVDEEDEHVCFVEFHCEDPEGAPEGAQKQLPPDLYVMAVDATIYRRMLDEVIASRTMPCGTFFCGHHEDVRHPDITIAVIVVAVTFVLLLAGTALY
ncbi:hypothetical protein ACHAWF_012074 [Thalassiosira exigua]